MPPPSPPAPATGTPMPPGPPLPLPPAAPSAVVNRPISRWPHPAQAKLSASSTSIATRPAAASWRRVVLPAQRLLQLAARVGRLVAERALGKAVAIGGERPLRAGEIPLHVAPDPGEL